MNEIKILIKNQNERKLKKIDHISFKVPNLNLFEKFPKCIYPLEQKGIYALIQDNKIIYIGKTIQLQNRLKTHRRTFIYDSYLFMPINNNFKLSLYEKILIVKYKPIGNIEVDRWFR